jgi:hypothetical protein
LTEGQIRNLERWGHPYVFDDFRFHMTLTGPIAADRRPAIVAMLQARFNRINGNNALRIARLVLARQDAPSARFRVICQAELAAPRRR